VGGQWFRSSAAHRNGLKRDADVRQLGSLGRAQGCSNRAAGARAQRQVEIEVRAVQPLFRHRAGGVGDGRAHGVLALRLNGVFHPDGHGVERAGPRLAELDLLGARGSRPPNTMRTRFDIPDEKAEATELNGAHEAQRAKNGAGHQQTHRRFSQ